MTAGGHSSEGWWEQSGCAGVRVMSYPRNVNEDGAGCVDALGYGGGKEGCPDLENTGRNRGKR